jgi:hypothetical protein
MSEENFIDEGYSLGHLKAKGYLQNSPIYCSEREAKRIGTMEPIMRIEGARAAVEKIFLKGYQTYHAPLTPSIIEVAEIFSLKLTQMETDKLSSWHSKKTYPFPDVQVATDDMKFFLMTRDRSALVKIGPNRDVISVIRGEIIAKHIEEDKLSVTMANHMGEKFPRHFIKIPVSEVMFFEVANPIDIENFHTFIDGKISW